MGEKQKIIDRSQQAKQQRQEQERERERQRQENEQKERKVANANVPMTPTQKFEAHYKAISNASTYSEYDRLYEEKFSKMTLLRKSVNENKEYFKKMRAMIKAEVDEKKQGQMMGEFRTIFNQRKENIMQYKNEAASIHIELKVIKQRINTYVIQQQHSRKLA